MMKRHEDTDTDQGVGAAARALMDAAAELTKAVSKGAIDDVTHRAGVQVSEALRDAAAAMERATRRSRGRGASTREDLLRAAGRVFAEKGFHDASLEEIAVRAGYTKGAIYAHFSSKDDLMLELMRRHVRGCEAAQEVVLVSAFREGRLPEVLDAPDRSADEFSGTDSLLGIEMMLYALRKPEHRDEFAQLLQEGIEDLARELSCPAREGDTDAESGGEAPVTVEPGQALAFAAIVNFGSLYRAIGVPAADAASQAAAMEAVVGRGGRCRGRAD